MLAFATQDGIVLSIVACATGFLAWRARRLFAPRANEACGGCANCETRLLGPANSPDDAVPRLVVSPDQVRMPPRT